MSHKCFVFAGYSHLKINKLRLRFKIEFRVLAVNFTICLLLIIRHNFASEDISLKSLLMEKAFINSSRLRSSYTGQLKITCFSDSTSVWYNRHIRWSYGI